MSIAPLKQSDEVELFTGANKTVGAMVLKFDTKEQLYHVTACFDEVVKV